jgi:hypothetical protein
VVGLQGADWLLSSVEMDMMNLSLPHIKLATIYVH